MDAIELHRLEKEVAEHHRAIARWAESTMVHEVLGDAVVWDGEVHVFELYGHPFARRVFVWRLGAGKRQRWQMVLAVPPVDTPAAAVRAVLAGAAPPPPPTARTVDDE